MLTSITPLGEQGRGNRWAVTTTAYAAGCLLGGAVTGVALGSLGSVLTDLPVLLAFLSSGCTTCQAFWTAFADPQLRVPGDARLVVVTKSLSEESPSALASRTSRELTLLTSSTVWDAFSVPGSPYFVLVDGSGRIVGEGSAATWPAVVTLMDQAHADAGRA